MRLLKNFALIFMCIATLVAGVVPSMAASNPSHRHANGTPPPTPMPAVISVTIVSLDRAVAILRGLYPHVRVSADRASNSIIVLGTPDEVQAMRTVIQGIDVKNPTLPTIEIVALHTLKAASLIPRLHNLYPNAQIAPATKTSLFIKATPLDMTQIKALVGTLDTPAATPAPSTAPAEALRVTQVRPRDAARALAHQLPHLRISVAGASIIVVGAADDIAKAKTLLSTIDEPGFGTRYTVVYRIKNIDATSVGDLVSRSYPSAKVNIDKDLNAISVYATAAEQQRIADAIAQLDGAANPQAGAAAGGAAGAGAAYGSGNVEVVELKSAIPGKGLDQPSTTITDIGTAVSNALQSLAPDLKITPVQNTNTLILSGSPQSIRMARELIGRLDRTPALVILDTEILELDENVARNIGLSLGQATISSSFQELQPPNDGNGQPGRLINLQPLGRTPISFTAVLNLQIQKGNARVLADPRITTLSGKMASIRAGDHISILTQTAGGPGTPITTQVQTLDTGVTLDITPIVNPDNGITVYLHPSVNSISPVVAGIIPTISQRETQTVVHLQDNQTLIIGGLIEEAQSKSMQKIPILGDIPLLGRVFRSDDINYTRNELIMVVTPHVLKSGEDVPPPGAAVLPSVPTPRPLPTLPANTLFPTSAPRSFQTPQVSLTPAPEPTPTQSGIVDGTGARFVTPSPSPTPSAIRTPSAFASANVFEFGSAPQNAFARETDAPQIFYASFGPTLVKQGTPVTVSAITTTNVQRVTIGIPGGYVTALSKIAPSKWQVTYAFSTSGIFSGTSPTTLMLTAYRGDGTTATLPIPISILNN